MDIVQKFTSDIDRVKKHNRDSSGKLNINNAVKQIASLFENANRGMCNLPHALTDYWISTYVNPNVDSCINDISSEITDKLIAMFAFLNNSDDTECLVLDDWREIADAVNYEAEDLPMDLLSQLMSTLVSKKAL